MPSCFCGLIDSSQMASDQGRLDRTTLAMFSWRYWDKRKMPLSSRRTKRHYWSGDLRYPLNTLTVLRMLGHQIFRIQFFSLRLFRFELSWVFGKKQLGSQLRKAVNGQAKEVIGLNTWFKGESIKSKKHVCPFSVMFRGCRPAARANRNTLREKKGLQKLFFYKNQTPHKGLP